MTEVVVVVDQLLEVIRVRLVACSCHNTRRVGCMTISIERLFSLSCTRVVDSHRTIKGKFQSLKRHDIRITMERIHINLRTIRI